MTAEILEQLKNELDYNPITGEFKWKYPKQGRARKDNSSYTSLVFMNKKYRKGRLAWFLFYGEYPSKDKIIHNKNGNHNDYRIVNLELVNSSELQRKIKPASTEKLTGAYFSKDIKKWKSSICIHNKVIHLGYFPTAIEAHQAYANKLREHLNG